VRKFETLKYKEANFRIHSSCFEIIKNVIIENRKLLDKYVRKNPEFLTALTPVEPAPGAPDIVRRMCEAAAMTGLGPMAAVAGTFSELAAEAAMEFPDSEVIVENGGDIFIRISRPLTIGIYAGMNRLSGKLAFSISPEFSPLSFCSSSSIMGHSISLGKCDLASVISKNASLADAAATLACNSVKSVEDFDATLKRIMDIRGIEGLLLVKDDKIAMAGNLPPIVKNTDPDMISKITKDQDYDIPDSFFSE